MPTSVMPMGLGPIGASVARHLLARANFKIVQELESQFRDVRDWNDLAALDDDKIRDLLGDEEEEQLGQLRQIARMLEEAGYIRQTRRGYELTPQGVRKIGEKALTDIFAGLKLAG